MKKEEGKNPYWWTLAALPEHGITITVIAPSTEEIQQYQEDQAEKERVATIVKKLNQENKKTRNRSLLQKQLKKLIENLFVLRHKHG